MKEMGGSTVVDKQKSCYTIVRDWLFSFIKQLRNSNNKRFSDGN